MKSILVIALISISLIVVSAQSDAVGKGSTMSSADSTSGTSALELLDRVFKPASNPLQALSPEKQSNGEVPVGDDVKVGESTKSCSRQGGLLEELVAALKSLGGLSTVLNGKRDINGGDSESRKSDMLQNMVASKPSVQVESTGARPKSSKRKSGEKKRQLVGKEERDDQELREARQRLIQMLQHARAMSQINIPGNDRLQSGQDSASSGTSDKKEVPS